MEVKSAPTGTEGLDVPEQGVASSCPEGALRNPRQDIQASAARLSMRTSLEEELQTVEAFGSPEVAS